MATPKEQLLSRTVYDTDGTTTIWEFAFSGGYLDPSHVKAYTVNAIGARTDLVINPATDVVGQFQLRVQPALAAGLELVIYRDTPKNLPLVDFTDESGFSEIALDTNAKQGVFIAAEAMDTANSLDVAAAIDAAVAASTAASAAQASQAAASSAANGAAISQSAANSSASAALAAQLAAESARNVAATEAAAAAVSATSANTSRTQAQASATAAQASATAAADSQTAAANSATAASSSATAAGSSASAANTSATAAADSQTAAANSASAAADSAASAATSAASVNPANFVQVTGNQTIGGIKTFSSAPVVPDDSFTFAKLQNIATATILGRSTAGTGDVGALTGAQATALLSGSLPVAVDVPAARLSGTVATARLGSGTANSTTFLRGDNTWAAVGVASTDFGGVGSYTMAVVSVGVNATLAEGSTVAGSSLARATDIGASSGGSNALGSHGTTEDNLMAVPSNVVSLGLTGTWRLMTRVRNGSGVAPRSVLGLFVRIS